MMMNEKTWHFVHEHLDDDVRFLALRGTKDDEVDLPMAIQQIAGRQMARRKLPSWAEVEGIIYPPHLNMEQCSSEQTARYKATIINGQSDNGTFVDLTGGFGIDFYWLSQGFQHRYYIEQNEALCAVSSKNFALLGLDCTVCCRDAVAYLATMVEPVSLIYLDPARRNEHGGRTYSIEDCTPNVLKLLPLLMAKTNRVMLKLSPMLDWRKAVEDIQKLTDESQKRIAYVSEVHIISVDNECKELILLLSREQTKNMRLVCVNGASSFEVFPTRTNNPHPERDDLSLLEKRTFAIGETAFLYEPNASIMKAGCFEEVEIRYPVRQIAPNSHLFVSADEIADFPGRKFEITAISSMNKHELKAALPASKQANITVRNFPMTAQQLRQKLKMKEGGAVYLFATTLADNSHRLFICRKIG